jgi:hypothetical protein
MGKLAVRAEILKLERLYGVAPQSLAFLESVPEATIRHLRLTAQERLFGDDLKLFQRLAAASVLLPQSLIAMVAEKIFGPVLGARVAGEMNWKRAVELANRLPIKFLADISLQLDPKRAESIIRNLPPARIREVAAELIQRREFVTMGSFVGYLSIEAIREAIRAITQPADLLHVAFFIDRKERLNELIRVLPDAQLMGVIVAAQDETQDLWSEAVALMTHVDADYKRKLGDLVAGQDQAALNGLLHTAHRQQLWDDVLPVVACMSDAAQRRLSGLAELESIDVLRGILHSVEQNDLWRALLPLVGTMPPQPLVLLAEIATTELQPASLEKILQAADEANLWPALLHLTEQMTEPQLQRIGQAAGVLPEKAIAAAIRAADERGLWHALLPLASRMAEKQKMMLASLAGQVPDDTRERIVEAARAADQQLWPALLDVIAHIPREERAGFRSIIVRHARDEPQLVTQLTPLAQTRGLDDLLQIATAAASRIP